MLSDLALHSDALLQFLVNKQPHPMLFNQLKYGGVIVSYVNLALSNMKALADDTCCTKHEICPSWF